MYQWYFNDSPINGATDTSWVVTQSGVYHVIAINTTGCVSFSDTMTAVYCDPSIEPIVSIAAQNLLVATDIPLGYEIQWLLNGFAISGQTNDSISTLMSGSYSVEITDTFGCVHTSAPFGVSLSVDELDVLNWNAYPNPANDYVIIEINNNLIPEMIQLVDLTGRTVKEWKDLKESNAKLDIADVPNGYFILRVVKGSHYWTQKLIIE
jgi:hypothetical protein